VVSRGADPVKYQLSILNQYIGSASVTNQFSSQIKNRINMLNKNYRMGSNWKIALIFPLVLVTFLFVSCTEKEPSSLKDGTSLKTTAADDSKIYYEVDEMPTFQGGEPVEFRRFIAQNIRYPKEAAENSVTGKIIVKFVVRKNGKVEIPDARELAKLEGIDIDEVVVVAYRPINENSPSAGEEYIELLKREAQRVVTTSPGWEPGKVNGEAVDVAFTFPIVFTLQ